MQRFSEISSEIQQILAFAVLAFLGKEWYYFCIIRNLPIKGFYHEKNVNGQ